MFKPGDIVLCIDNAGLETHLTNYQIYRVLGVNKPNGRLVLEFNITKSFPSDRFIMFQPSDSGGNSKETNASYQ